MTDELIKFAEAQQENILLSYQGTFSNQLIVDLGESIQKYFSENPRFKRKFFLIFMELAQNVSYYSAEVLHPNTTEEERIGLFYLSENEDAYLLTTGNVIHNVSLDRIKQKIAHINKLNHTDLRKLRLDTVHQKAPHESKGAGVGLMKISLIAENPIEIKSKQLDNLTSFFTITVKINKQKKVLGMENLNIKAEKNEFFTPQVSLNASTGVCEIAGESYLEYTGEFYDQIIAWLKKYYQEVHKAIEFNFKLTYFNTSSFKALMSVLKQIKKIKDQGAEVEVNWFFPQDDEDILKDAQDLAEGAELDLNFIPFQPDYDDED